MSAVPPLLALAAGRRVRPRKAPVEAPKELALHLAVADTLRRFAKPDWQWTHFPAGEPRDPRTAAKLKAMGLRPGWPDIVLLSPAGLFHALELKRAGEDLGEAQEAFQTWAIGRGVPYAVARSVDDALAILGSWGCLRVAIRTGRAV